MRRVALLLLAAGSFSVAGCSFSSPKNNPDGGGDDGPIVDAPADTPVDGAPICAPWTSRGGHVKDVCGTPLAAPWTVSGAGGTYDTTTGSFSSGAAPAGALVAMTSMAQMRVVSVGSFQIDSGATLRVVGPYPLVILSASTIQIDGTLDVSSNRTTGRGPGSDLPGCQFPANGAGATDAGGGGGGGYGFGGEDGGDGSSAVGSGTFGAGSIGRRQFNLSGGCHGANGGSANAATGGDGGGGVQLTARTSITIAGTINAGGMGGQGAQASGGGGGGGSGGHIGLDAPQITAMPTARIAANGGGGGTGCKGTGGDPGQDGKALNMAAAGGAAASCAMNGRDGGDGGYRSVPLPGIGGANTDGGGGGGGGGMGFIIVWAPAAANFTIQAGAIVSPTEILVTALEAKP